MTFAVFWMFSHQDLNQILPTLSCLGNGKCSRKWVVTIHIHTRWTHGLAGRSYSSQVPISMMRVLGVGFEPTQPRWPRDFLTTLCYHSQLSIAYPDRHFTLVVNPETSFSQRYKLLWSGLSLYHIEILARYLTFISCIECLNVIVSNKFQLRYLPFSLYTIMRIFIGYLQRFKHTPCLINTSHFRSVSSLHIIV